MHFYFMFFFLVCVHFERKANIKWGSSYCNENNSKRLTCRCIEIAKVQAFNQYSILVN